MISAFGEKQDLEMEGIKHLYQRLEKGYNSMPLDLPGTPFHKAMKVRRYLAPLSLEFYVVFVLHTLYFLRVNSIKETYIYIYIDFVYLQFLIITGAGF